MLELEFLRAAYCRCRATVTYMQNARTQTRQYTERGTAPSSKEHDRHESMSLDYLMETYPVVVTVFALSLYICAVWLVGLFI